MSQLLLYNISPARLAKMRVIFLRLGLRAVVVSPESWGKPIGSLLGMETDVQPEAGEPFTDEMMIMCNLPQVNPLLTAMRQQKVSIALKAMVTETNVHWSSYRLHAELAAEHEALKKNGTAVHKEN